MDSDRHGRRARAAAAGDQRAGLRLTVGHVLHACATAAGWAGPRVVSDSQSAARTLSDWSRIEAVPVGTKTEVQLYDDEAPPDSRRVTGRFHAATADTLTLTLEDLTATSSTRTLVKSAVHSVFVRRPIKKRYAGWATLVGGTLGLILYYTRLPDPLTPVGGFVVGATYAAPASLLGFLLDRRQRIYEVPQRLHGPSPRLMSLPTWSRAA